jgi:hypothetical protein
MKKLKKLAKIIEILVRIWHDLIELYEVIFDKEENDDDGEEVDSSRD